jgi:DNA processing protein
MESTQGKKISTYAPSALLGRSLNDVERKFAPSKLYAAGSMQIPLPRPRVAMVGSREATPKSVADAEAIAKTLTRESVVIVSGLAKGIDSAAHKAAIDSGGQTIAVLGTPLDRVYPQENAQLQAEIIKHHLAISQYEIGSVVARSNFVRRNRTMALIADASVIVQAGESSGSLSQGYEALRLGRPLFIWKTLFESSLKWPKEMVRYGAMTLSDPKELLENLPSKKSVLEISL